MNALTISERTELAVLERTIDRGLETFREVGEALARIRDKLLYREHYTSFRDYCAERWAFTDRHARRLIVGAQVAADCGPIAPRTESQARELSPLPPPLRRQVFESATDHGNQRTTASTLRLLTQEALAALPPEQQLQAVEAKENRLRAGGVDKDGRPRPTRSQAEARKAAIKSVQIGRRHLLHAGPGATAEVKALDGVIQRLQVLAA